MSSDLEAIDKRVLSDLDSARNLAPNIAENIGEPEAAVKTSLERLFEHGVVNHVGHGLYELSSGWAARYHSHLESPTDAVAQGDTVYTTTESGDDGGMLVIGRPDMNYVDWCALKGTSPGDDGEYQAREAATKGPKDDVPVVEAVNNWQLHGGDALLETLLGDGHTLDSAIEYIRGLDVPVIGLPVSDVYVAQEAPDVAEVADDE